MKKIDKLAIEILEVTEQPLKKAVKLGFIATRVDSLITSAVEAERERITKSINPQYKPKP